MVVFVGALIAPFLLTFLANNSSFGKDTDTTLSSAPHIGFIMLNYVVDNIDYYNAALLGRQPFPYLYSNFIGYPVLLGAFFAVLLAIVRHPLIDKFSSVIYLISVNVLMVLILASGDMQRWIIGFDIAPITQFVTGLRNLTLVASYAGGLMVLLAALCGDVLIRQLQVSNAMINIGNWKIQGRAHWLVVCIMVWHVLTLYAYNKQFYVFGDIDLVTKTASEFLETQPLGGINVEANFQVFPVVTAQRKVITQMFYPWFLINVSPAGELYSLKSAPPDDMSTWQELKRLDDTWVIYKSTDVNQQYALHTSEQTELTPCTASGTGGDIDVWCTVSSPGVLRIYENNLGGWQSWVDDMPAEVTDVNKFVAVSVPKGKHHIAFRYRPWYTILGLAISWVTWLVLIVYAGIAVVRMINSKRMIPAELPLLNVATE
jgi:hypothetical protein